MAVDHVSETQELLWFMITSLSNGTNGTNPPYWDANCPLGHLKQRKLRLTSFVLDVPVGNLRPSMADLYHVITILQRAHWFKVLAPKSIVARACTFFRALRRLRVITSSFDWFTGLPQ